MTIVLFPLPPQRPSLNSSYKRTDLYRALPYPSWGLSSRPLNYFPEWRFGRHVISSQRILAVKTWVCKEVPFS